MRTLITGADGFVGRWLVDHLSIQGDDIWLGVGRAVDVAAGQARVVDVRDPAAVASLVAWARPEAIYHLAAVAFGPDARRSVRDAVEINVRGTANVVEAASRLSPPPVVLIPSSSEVYGAPMSLPISEDHPVRTASAYGATKLAQEAVGLAYDLAGAVPVVVARAFNHIGPGQRDVFVVSAFASQLASVVVGAAPPTLRVGNLSAARDFTDVRDVVRAYRLLVAGSHHGSPINVASGTAVTVAEVLQRLIELSGREPQIEVDPSLVRPVDVPRVIGDAGKLSRLTGWRPEVPLDVTIADVWTDALDRARVNAGP